MKYRVYWEDSDGHDRFKDFDTLDAALQMVADNSYESMYYGSHHLTNQVVRCDDFEFRRITEVQEEVEVPNAAYNTTLEQYKKAAKAKVEERIQRGKEDYLQEQAAVERSEYARLKAKYETK